VRRPKTSSGLDRVDQLHPRSGYFTAVPESVFSVCASSSVHFYSDTWAWDGKTWTRVATEGPPARIQFAMGYDSSRDRVVLFGGVNDKPQRVLNDVWEFDGTKWTQKQP
jgi:hypothetical protein